MEYVIIIAVVLTVFIVWKATGRGKPGGEL